MIPDLVLALVDKSLSILDSESLKYKMKVEVCKLLQLFALKMIQTPENFQKTEFELILSKLKYLSIDRILRVQMAAKSALKRWQRLHVRIQNLDKDSMDLMDPNDLKNEESLILKKIKKSNPKNPKNSEDSNQNSDKGTFTKMNSIQRGIDCFIENNLIDKTYHKQNAHNFVKKRSGIGGGFVKHIDNYKAHAGKPSFNVIREQLKRRIMNGNITVREDGSVHIEGEDSDSEIEQKQKMVKSQIQEESEEYEDEEEEEDEEGDQYIDEDDNDRYINPEDSLEVEIPQRHFKKDKKIEEKNLKKIKVGSKNKNKNENKNIKQIKQINLKAQSDRRDIKSPSNTSREDYKHKHAASERPNMQKKLKIEEKRKSLNNIDQENENGSLLRVSEVSEEDNTLNHPSMKKTIEKNKTQAGNNNFMPKFEMAEAPQRQQSRPNTKPENLKKLNTPETQPTLNHQQDTSPSNRHNQGDKNGPELTEITRATHLNKGDLSVSQLPEYSNNQSVRRTDPYYSPTYLSAHDYDDLQDTIDLRENNVMGSGLSETIKVVENEYFDPAETRKASEYDDEEDYNPSLADTIYFGQKQQKQQKYNNHDNYDIGQNISINNTEPGRHYYETNHQQELEIDLDDVRKNNFFKSLDN